MIHEDCVALPRNSGVSLVNGKADIRHARQLLLRSENYDVRSYPTGAALLADVRSRDFACIVIDMELHEADSLELLPQMRASGWRGTAIILNAGDPEGVVARGARLNGDWVFEHSIADRRLLNAIAASIAREGPS